MACSGSNASALKHGIISVTAAAFSGEKQASSTHVPPRGKYQHGAWLLQHRMAAAASNSGGIISCGCSETPGVSAAASRPHHLSFRRPRSGSEKALAISCIARRWRRICSIGSWRRNVAASRREGNAIARCDACVAAKKAPSGRENRRHQKRDIAYGRGNRGNIERGAAFLPPPHTTLPAPCDAHRRRLPLWRQLAICRRKHRRLQRDCRQ